MKDYRNRRSILAAGALLAAIISYAFFFHSANPDAAVEMPGAPAAGALQPHIFAGGVVEGSSPELGLRFETTGRLKSLLVREGDLLEEGDLLAELDSQEYELKLNEAQAQLNVVAAERDRLHARRKLHAEPLPREVTAADRVRSRTERTVTTGPIVRVGGESMEPAVAPEDAALADARVAQAEFFVRSARLQLEKTRLIAPAPLLVIRVHGVAGELTGPASVLPVLTLAKTDRLCVRAFVEELDAPHVYPGQTATITTVAAPDRPIPGVVARCAPELRPRTHHQQKPGERIDWRVREIMLEIEESPDLILGLPVEVQIESSVPSLE